MSIVTAVGVAAGASAAQLGLGYGLGIIVWIPAWAPEGEAAWIASLAWATWIAATSVLIGAICADRLAGSPGPESTVGKAEAWVGRRGSERYGPVATALWRLALAMTAAIGAAVTVALVAVPARSAERADSFAPETIAGAYAVIGVVAGLILAFGALTSAAMAANVIATVGWLWLLAVVAVIHGVLTGRGLTSAQLGVWEFTSDGPWLRNLYVPGMVLSLTSALVIGGLAALPAARREDNRVGVAISGAVGPLLVAMAYFLATPRLGGAQAEQFSAYLIATYAVIAGLAGSVLVSALGPVRNSEADGSAPDQPARPARKRARANGGGSSARGGASSTPGTPAQPSGKPSAEAPARTDIRPGDKAGDNTGESEATAGRNKKKPGRGAQGRPTVGTGD